jgi:hypothetical protein
VACAPDRTLFVLAGASEVHVRRWPFAEHQERKLEIGEAAETVALDARGRLAIQTRSGVAVHDAGSGTRLGVHELGLIGAAGVAWAPDGELAAVQSSLEAEAFGTKTVVGMAGDTLEPRWVLELPYACAAAYSPSGALLALGSWEKGLVARRSGAGVVIDDEPPDEEQERVSVAPRDDEEWQIIGYVEVEASEGVVGLEKRASERVGGVSYDVWDVRCESSRWWAITPPLAAYDQLDHPDFDVALTFHIGVAARLAEDDR